MLDNEQSLSLKAMASVLKVTRSGYYQWKKTRNNTCNRSVTRKARDKAIKDLFVEHKARAGARRIQKDLEEAGMSCCLKTIAASMKRQKLVPKASRNSKSRQRTVSTTCLLLQTCCIETFQQKKSIKNGPVTSRIYAHPKVGCIWLLLLTSTLVK